MSKQTTTLEALRLAIDVRHSLSLACRCERRKMTREGVAEISYEIAGQIVSWPIYLYVLDRDKIYHSIALATLRQERWIDHHFEMLDPPSAGDWLDRWGVLTDPNIANWIKNYGEQYPIFVGFVPSAETLRNLLRRMRDEQRAAS